MAIPDFLRTLRERIGHDFVLLPGVVAAIEREDGAVLILKRRDTGEWSLPSGICEPGEHPSRTIAREVLEETGLQVRPTEILAVFGGVHVRYPNQDEAAYVTTLFRCALVGGALECRDGEALELRWVRLAELPDLRIEPHMPATLADLLAGEAPAFAWDDAWLRDDG